MERPYSPPFSSKGLAETNSSQYTRRRIGTGVTDLSKDFKIRIYGMDGIGHPFVDRPRLHQRPWKADAGRLVLPDLPNCVQ